MKKIFTLAAAFMATAVSFQAAADTWTVTDKTEFMSAWGNLGRTAGARDTIYWPKVLMPISVRLKTFQLPVNFGLSVKRESRVLARLCW